MRRLPKSETGALAALLALAAALRLTGIEYGLPFGTLLNPDEAQIVPRAWELTHGGGADPGWFEYPSFFLYVLAPVEWLFDAPSYLAARLVVVALALGGIAAAWWLGRAAYGAVAGLVAAAAVAVDATHADYSRMAVTDVPLALGVAVTLAFAVRGHAYPAAIAAGVATAFKYPGVLLLVPIAVLAWRDPHRLVRAVGLAAAAFVATSPFVLIRWWSGASEDVARVRRLAQDGWLGFEHDFPTPLAFLDRLWEGQGPFLFVALAGFAVALVRRTRADLVLASFVLAYYAALLTVDAHFDRYVLPLVPPLAALAGRLGRVPALLLVVPLAWSIADAIERTRTDTRVVAHEWIVDNLPRGRTIATDPSTAPLDGYVTIRLELPGPKRGPDPNRDVETLRGAGVEYVLVTGAVADRVATARDRYPRESRFYEELRTDTRRLFYVQQGDGLAGPWVALYGL